MLKQTKDYSSKEVEHLVGGKGSATVRPYFEPTDFGGTHVKFCSLVSVHPDGEIGLHRHDGEDEIYIFQKGHGIVDDNGTVKEVKAGDSMLIGRGQSHSVTNTGDVDLELIAVIVTY